MKAKRVFSLVMFLLISAPWAWIGSSHAQGVSAPFVLDVRDPVVNLFTPHGGESLDYLVPVQVSWDATDDNLSQHAVKVELLVFPEQETHTLLADAASSGSEMLQLPHLQSVQAAIRVVATDMFGNTGSAQTMGYMTLGTGSTSITDGLEISTSGIVIYPNPATGHIMVAIQGEEPGYADVWLTDIQGRQLERRTVHFSADTSLSFDVSQLAPGLYFLAMDKAGKVVSSKFIVH